MNIVSCFVLSQSVLIACTGSTKNCDRRSRPAAGGVVMGRYILVCGLDQDLRVQFLSNN
jgi:hypothetical protein